MELRALRSLSQWLIPLALLVTSGAALAGSLVVGALNGCFRYVHEGITDEEVRKVSAPIV